MLEPWPVECKVALPRVVGASLCAFLADGSDGLVAGAFGVLEPPAGAVEVDPGTLDLILVPGLAFDSRGGRLGRGKGYYDRFLAGAAGLKVGVCFSDQIVEEVPCEAHDVAVDVLVTPEGVIFCGPRNMG